MRKGWPFAYPPPNKGWVLNRDSPQCQGLVSWYMPVGLYQYDVIRSAFHGPTGTVTPTVDGSFGVSMQYAGSSNQCSTTYGLSNSTPFTFSLWGMWTSVRITYDYNCLGRLISSSGFNVGAFFLNPFATPDSIICGFRTSVPDDQYIGDETVSPVTLMKPYHLVFVHDAASRRFYLDGKLIGSNATGLVAESLTGASLGIRSAGTQPSNTRITDARVYNKALNLAEITALREPKTRWDLFWVPHFQMVVGKPPAGAAAQTISPSGIASAEAFGSATLTPGAVTVSPSGIASTEAFGALALHLNIATTGIASAEAFGSATLAPGTVTVSPSGIASTEAFGTAVLTPGAVTVSPSGIASGEAFGAAVMQPGVITVSLTGIASVEAFGTAIVSVGAITIALTGIASLEAFGTAQLNLNIVAVGIASSESFGTPVIVLYIVTTGIASSEAFGTAILVLILSPSGITSGEAFGTAIMQPGAVTVSPTGISSLEAFGAALLTLAADQTVTLIGIISGETFGTLLVFMFSEKRTITVPASNREIKIDDPTRTITVPSSGRTIRIG